MWNPDKNCKKGFIVLYRTVFAPSGQVNPNITQNACKKLVTLANQCDEEHIGIYGRNDTGFLNAENLKTLYARIVKENT